MRKQGLRQLIYQELQQKRFMTFQEAETFAKSYGYRTSNLERRMRETENIEAIKSTEPPYHITGYRYTGTEKPKIEIFNQRQVNLF